MPSHDLAILIVHGMGLHAEGFERPLEQRLRSKLTAEESLRVKVRGCLWDPITQPMQEYVYGTTRKWNVGYRGLHEFGIDALGDPVAYLSTYYHVQSGEKNPRSFYQRIHDCVHDSLKQLTTDTEPDAPLMVLAHSLGSVIATNYRWDCEHEKPKTSAPPIEPMERMENLVSLITYGSNIPLFLGMDPRIDQIQSIAFPPDPRFLPVATWDNVFSRNDVLGWPLADLWTDGCGPQKRIDDHEMSVGPWWSWKRYTPMAHSIYEEDAGFVDLIAGRIQSLLHSPVFEQSAARHH